MKRKKGLGPYNEIISKEILKEIGVWTAVIVVLLLFVYLARVS